MINIIVKTCSVNYSYGLFFGIGLNTTDGIVIMILKTTVSRIA